MGYMNVSMVCHPHHLFRSFRSDAPASKCSFLLPPFEARRSPSSGLLQAALFFLSSFNSQIWEIAIDAEDPGKTHADCNNIFGTGTIALGNGRGVVYRFGPYSYEQVIFLVSDCRVMFACRLSRFLALGVEEWDGGLESALRGVACRDYLRDIQPAHRGDQG